MIEEIAIRMVGTDLYAQQRGSNPHAVFLHGFGDDLHTWDSVWEVLGDGVPALRYDLRGFGRSACRENVPYNHADDLSVEWSDAWRERWGPIVDAARSGAMGEAKRLWWEHPLFSSTRASAAGPALFESIMRYSGAQWISDGHVQMLPDVERLHLLGTRTLLLTGGRDLDDFRLIADLIEVNASDLERRADPARGHLLHLEDPVGCARRIKSFLPMECQPS